MFDPDGEWDEGRHAKYLQCVLVRIDEEGREYRQVSGIPVKYAIKGMVLTLRGQFGWKVESVDGPVQPYSDAVRRRHRQNTGDALHK